MNRCMRGWSGILGLVLAIGGLSALSAEEHFFGLTNAWEFHLTMTQAGWETLTPVEVVRDRSGPGAMRPGGPGGVAREYPWGLAAFEGAGNRFTNVAVRFKGNSSYHMSQRGLKRPFKLNFNRGAPGRSLLGHKELLLNNNMNDGAQFREALAYEVFRRAGLPAPRTAFAKVFLTRLGCSTNEYLGLYTVVEAVENDFLQAHWGTRKGLLLKPERLPGLRYLGPDWAAYTNRYEPKNTVRDTDAARFIALARLVDEAGDAELVRELPARLDLVNLVRFVAVNALLANYDSLIGTGHNYYLFQPPKGAPAVCIPWDLNESFGGHPPGGTRSNQAGFSVLRPLASPIRLVDRVLSQPDWADAYRRELSRLLTNAFAPERILADARSISAVTKDAVFAESARARMAFERSALGAGLNGADTEPRPDRVRGLGDGGPGGPPGRLDDMGFEEWVRRRGSNVVAELSGSRAAPTPQLLRGPGGPRPAR